MGGNFKVDQIGRVVCFGHYHGPPPGGGYGPPMGAPMGMPMPQQQPQKKSNIGMIIGIGCGGLFLLTLIGVGIAYYYINKAAKAVVAAIPSAFPVNSAGGIDDDPFDLKPPSSGNLKAELKDLRNFKADFGSSIHFVGEIHNTGADPIGYPSAKITFLDATNTAIDSGTCSSMIRDLAPGEKVPCSFSLFKTKTWASYKTEIKPVRPLFVGKAAKLKISDTKFTAKKGYNPHQVTGKITNESTFKAKGVWALVSLYDKDGKICGADNALVAGNDLDAGQGGVFTAKVYNVAGTPDTFRVLAIGYGE